MRGLLIHEGQLTYHEEGLKKILDLGAWWKKETGLPLPMGGNVIRRELGEEVQREVSRWLHRSIEYSMAHRQDALAYAMQFARDMTVELADKFVAMWVNDRTLGYGDNDRRAVQLLLDKGFQQGVIPQQGQGGIRWLTMTDTRVQFVARAWCGVRLHARSLTLPAQLVYHRH